VFSLCQDGLYVLLRPEKKKKHGSAAEALRAIRNDGGSKVPDHLKHLVMQDMPAETCPWSLSGPQFPQPTAIQQRYCYPKGDPEYAGRKGGALWTMYGRDGKEDFQFRLLHVYFSAKRAVNKGVILSEEDKITQQLQNQAANAAAVAATDTPGRQRKRVSRAVRSPWQERQSHRNNGGKRYLPFQGADGSPPEHPSKRRKGSNSQHTLLPPPSPFQRNRNVFCENGDESVYVSPNTAASSDQSGYGGNPFDQIFDHPPFHPVPSFDIDENGKPDAGAAKTQFPFRGTGGRASLEHFRALDGRTFIESNDSFSYNEAAATEIGGAGAALEPWNDSLFAFSSKPSFEQGTPKKHPTIARANDVDPSITSVSALKTRLGHVHERIRAGILAHPPSEQGPLLSIVASWARSVAASPLVPTLQNDRGQTGPPKVKESISPSVESTAV
jgi:hypothetical protein